MEMISFDAIVEDGVIKIPERLRSSLPSGARVTVETIARADAEDDGRVGPFSKEIIDRSVAAVDAWVAAREELRKTEPFDWSAFDGLKIDTTGWKFDREECYERS